MDAIALATVTSALTVLATESVKGIANSAGKDLWARAKQLFGWKADPALPDLAVSIASSLERDEALMAQVVNLLKSGNAAENSGTALVGRIEATKVVVAHRIDVAGDFNM